MKFISRTRIMLLGSVVLAIIATATTHHLITTLALSTAEKGRLRMVEVITAAQDLQAGTTLTAGQLAVRSVSAEAGLVSAISGQEQASVVGRVLAFSVRRDEPLMRQYLTDAGPTRMAGDVGAGNRAITIPVDDNNSMAGSLQRGDHIDLVVAIKRDGSAFLKPLLLDVPVLATGAYVVDATPREGRRSYTTITLNVSVEDAMRVTAAREIGRLVATLRAPGDHATVSMRREEAQTLVGVDEPRHAVRASPPRVTILYGTAPPAGGGRGNATLSALEDRLHAAAGGPGM